MFKNARIVAEEALVDYIRKNGPIQGPSSVKIDVDSYLFGMIKIATVTPAA